MSTVKTDAITAVSTNGDLSLDGLGTGGVSIASTLKMTKGGDISSASPLVIDVDGNYFDVTGTTNFSAMTVESGNFFMLQFDGALTITHGSGIELPGAANLTTATGDRLICYATAANTVEVMSVETEAAASSGGWTITAEQATTSGSSITFGSIPSGVSVIKVMLEGISGTAINQVYHITIGDSGGLETSGYLSKCNNLYASTDTAVSTASYTLLGGSNVVASKFTGIFTLANMSVANNTWVISGNWVDSDGSSLYQGATAGGVKDLSAELTQLSFYTSKTLQTGNVSIMYQ